jgi:ATP-dependent DNA helicase RecG
LETACDSTKGPNDPKVEVNSGGGRMTSAELDTKLTELLGLPAETEWVEFKEAKNDDHFDRLGEYFSALSNEANLKSQPWAWLVFGVKDKPKQIVGSNYRTSRAHLDSLKEEIANQTSNRLTFEEIHEVARPEGRVVMFQIPPALRGMPTAWKGHFYGRDNEAIGPLSLHEIEQIRKQVTREDWSAQTCSRATLNDLDPQAIAFARQEFKKKYPKLIADADGWDDLTFLNKAKVCIGGKITRTALILLGKPESTHYLSPAHPQLTWILKDRDGMERDYKHFDPPFLLAVDALLTNVRNLTCRVLPWGTLFPVELLQYDAWVLREVLHNAIAHQDYPCSGRINVVEFDDRLVVANMGSFLPGDVEDVIRRDAPFSVERNPFLAQAMVGLQMIDTIGSGIKRIYQVQKKRSFPMPDYDLSQLQEVQVGIIGKVLDEKYTRILMARTELDLWDVIALDKVQKGRRISYEQFRSLKAKKLVEGRRPNLFVSAEIAAATDTRAEYIKKRAFDKEHYKKMIVAYLEQFGEARREDLDKLLVDKLSDALDEEQKATFVTNLLQEMRREKIIRAEGSKRWATWRLT